jgi:hypothetical protein
MICDILEAGARRLEAGGWKPVILAFLLGITGVRFGLFQVAIAEPLFAATNSRELKAALPDSASVFLADKGTLRITIGGQTIGSEEFEMSQSGVDWIAHSSMSAHSPGGSEIKASGNLRLAADGAPLHYDWSAEAQKKAKGSVEFANGTAKCSADFGTPSLMRKDFVFSTPRIAVLDNNLYFQYSVLAQVYDWKASGKQSFPVVIPQDMVPGTISVESLGPQQAATGKYDALRVSTPDLEITLYLDAKHRLMRLEVPSSNAVIDRE